MVNLWEVKFVFHLTDLVLVIEQHLLQVAIRVRDGKKLAHDGIKVEFVGSIGTYALMLVPPPSSSSVSKNFSTTAGIIMNFFRYHKSLQPPGRCDRRKRSTSISRTSRNSSKAIRESTSNYGLYILAALGVLSLGSQDYLGTSCGCPYRDEWQT